VNPQKATKLLESDLEKAVVNFYWDELRNAMEESTDPSIIIPSIGTIFRRKRYFIDQLYIRRRRLYRKYNGSQLERARWRKESRHLLACHEANILAAKKYYSKKKVKYAYFKNLGAQKANS